MTRALTVALVLACGAARAQNPAPADPAVGAPGDAGSSDSAAEPALNPTDPEALEQACRELLLEHAPARALGCYRALAADERLPEDTRARALATVELLTAWARGDTARPAAQPAQQTAPQKQRISVSELVSESVKEGLAEGVVASAALGAVGATSLTAAILARQRTDRITSTPLLLAAPALGGAAGAALGYGLLQAFEPAPGDVALTTSAAMLGFVAAFPLQLALFDGNDSVEVVPLRFLAVLGGGAVGAFAGGIGAGFLDVSQGDVALAHSAALWTTVLMLQLMSYREFGGSAANFAILFNTSLVLPYAVVIAAHQAVEINRFATWLIEAGGVAGLMCAGAAALVAQSNDPRPFFIGGTLAGVGAGVVAAWFADDFLDHAEDAR